MKKQRVDIELEEETLKWAGIEAAKLGISRRKYLAQVISEKRTENDGYTVKRPCGGVIPKARLIPKED